MGYRAIRGTGLYRVKIIWVQVYMGYHVIIVGYRVTWSTSLNGVPANYGLKVSGMEVISSERLLCTVVMEVCDREGHPLIQHGNWSLNFVGLN